MGDLFVHFLRACFENLCLVLGSFLSFQLGLAQLTLSLSLVGAAFYIWYMLFGFVLLPRFQKDWHASVWEMLRQVFGPHVRRLGQLLAPVGAVLEHIANHLSAKLAKMSLLQIACIGLVASVAVLAFLQLLNPSFYGAKIELTSEELIWDARVTTSKALLGFSWPQPYTVDITFPLNKYVQLAATQGGGLLLLVIVCWAAKLAHQRLQRYLATVVSSEEKLWQRYRAFIKGGYIICNAFVLLLASWAFYLWFTYGLKAAVCFLQRGAEQTVSDLGALLHFVWPFVWAFLLKLWAFAKLLWCVFWKIVYVLISGWFF